MHCIVKMLDITSFLAITDDLKGVYNKLWEKLLSIDTIGYKSSLVFKKLFHFSDKIGPSTSKAELPSGEYPYLSIIQYLWYECSAIMYENT